MSNTTAKIAAGKAVVEALEGLSNGEIIEVLAATAVSHVASGADSMGLTGTNRAGFITLGLGLFNKTVTTMAADVVAKPE